MLQLSLPTIKRSHKFVLLAACLFAAGSTLFMLALRPAAPKNTLSYHCFKTERGWGYDVLVNETIIIHQPFKPRVSGSAGFSNEQQAGAAAQIVIEKIKSGEIPILTHQQLQHISVLRTQSK